MRNSRGYIAGAAFTALVAVMAFIIGLVIASNINFFQGKNVQESFAQENILHSVSGITEPRKNPFTPIAKEILPTVVNISAERVVKVRSPFFDFPFEEFFGGIPREFERKSQSLGSGIVFSKDGYILTNNHVIEGADKIIITFSDNTTFTDEEVEVVGTDPRTDVAVLKIKAKKNLRFARLGDSDKIEIGDWAIAFGNPFGFNQTMTVGVISAKGRTQVPLIHGPTYQDFIQTDAAINSGNSGGPLVNIDGEIIGINSAIASPSGGNVGIGFAIPINLAKSIANQLIKKGKITRGWLGVAPQELTPEIAKGFGLKDTRGVLIAKVISDSPADKGGLEDGDIIIKFDAKQVEDLSKFRFMVAEAEPGKRVKIAIIRNGKERKITVKIGKMSGDEEIAKKGNNEKGWLGLTVADMDPGSKETGVTVKKAESKSSADNAGIEAEDIIKRIGNIFIRDSRDYEKAKKVYEESSHITFQIKKPDGYIIFLAVEQ
ncbi:MAG: Do family serine endopeptidase [Candidatus Cloacimonadota bacterium]|nr:MAG: Do family serine endopeptidase [Candidatus Cloacimonadota bacterium]